MLHVALVGAGGMARHYRKAYTTLPDVEWSVAVDLDPEQLELCRQIGARLNGKIAETLLGWNRPATGGRHAVG
jgi:predicted dehydrogenase